MSYKSGRVKPPPALIITSYYFVIILNSARHQDHVVFIKAKRKCVVNLSSTKGANLITAIQMG